jgi:hypothetical protein
MASWMNNTKRSSTNQPLKLRKKNATGELQPSTAQTSSNGSKMTQKQLHTSAFLQAPLLNNTLMTKTHLSKTRRFSKTNMALVAQ